MSEAITSIEQLTDYHNRMLDALNDAKQQVILLEFAYNMVRTQLIEAKANAKRG